MVIKVKANIEEESEGGFMKQLHIEKINDSNTEFPKVTLWEKGTKSRLYVDGCGYITEDDTDVKGRNNDYYKGFWYQYDRPGKSSTLRRIIEIIADEV